MEERKEEGQAEIQEHGPEHWFSKWERQCLEEAEQDNPDEEEREQSPQKLWHLFQNSATAVAQLYKGGLHTYRSYASELMLIKANPNGIVFWIDTKGTVNVKGEIKLILT
ncbi:hypothetical protein GOODEAATRI_029876 [Goodea atripinnis]|uniref:Uncharacterized protein n=1 Tax=Goodea atripinnis TaxID=208336 RepID=A0ABV0PST9_9TELE